MNNFSSAIHRISIVLLIGCLFCGIAGFMPARPAKAQTGQAFDITLAELGYGDQTLRGPLAYSNYYYFGLPTDWELQPEGNYLDLDLTYAVSGRESHAPTLLDVQLNGTVLETINLETPGVQQVRVELPLDDLRVSEDRLLNGLRFNLSVSTVCEEAQLTSLTIEASSSLHFAYRERPLQLDLAQWPKPLYQWHMFDLSRVRLVLPAEPNAGDVQAATIVAASLGRLSNNGLPLAVSLASDQMSSSFPNEHLIVIGRPGENLLLDQLDLPLPLAQRQLELRSRIPASVAPGQAFSYTLTVENTSSSGKRLVVEDRLSSNGTLLGCLGRCQESESGVLRWDVGRVAAGQQISTVVSVRLAASVSPGERIEHTASLLDDKGTVINVDTLAAEVGTTEDGQTITSAFDKGSYFFVQDNQGVAESEGLVQALISPWSPKHAVVVVTGLGEEALLKAAHALGARSRLPGMSGTYAIVRDVKFPSDAESEVLAEDISLAALGYEDNVLMAAIFESLQYTFDVPREWALSQDSYLALHFAHSIALSEMSATLDVMLNDTPFGSVRLDDENATDTWVTLPLPTTSLLDGQNRLEMRVGARQDDVCVDLRNTHRWLAVYADSFFHLPSERTSLALDLQGFPRPFSDSSDLRQVAFLLPRQPTIEEMEGVLRLASRLGNAARGSGFWPRVLLGGDPQSQPQDGYDLIAIGRPTENPFIAAVNDSLPQPFRPNTDEIRQQVDHVIYQLPPGISLGYVQELLSPWDEGRAVLVATGTTDEGVTWAMNALVDDRLNWQLAGNLALVREDSVVSVDTREETERVGQVTQDFVPELTPEATVEPTPKATAVPAASEVTPADAIEKPSSDQSTPRVTAGRPVWLVPLLIAAIATAIVGVGISLRRERS